MRWSSVIPFPNIDPVFIDLGFFQIRWYALAYIFGIVLGWQYVQMILRADRLWATKNWQSFPREWTATKLPLIGLRIPHPRLSFEKKTGAPFKVQKPISAVQVDDLLLWAALGVIFGGRLGYILLYAMWYPNLRDFYFANPLQMFAVWEGGMSFHGGALGVILAVLIFAKANKLDAIRVGDVVAPAVPIGLFFGRIANFINGELWGKVTTVPWGVVFPSPYAGPLPRHPSQLYEAGLEGIVLFGILWFLVWQTRALHKRGLTTGVYLLGYAIARFSVEFVREAKDFIGSPDNWFTMGMLFSIPMALAGLAFIWFALKAPTAAKAS